MHQDDRQCRKLTLNYNTLISDCQTLTNNTDFYQHHEVINTVEVSTCITVEGLLGRPKACYSRLSELELFLSPTYYDSDAAVVGDGDYMNTYTLDGEFEFHMQIGSQLYSE